MSERLGAPATCMRPGCSTCNLRIVERADRLQLDAGIMERVGHSFVDYQEEVYRTRLRRSIVPSPNKTLWRIAGSWTVPAWSLAPLKATGQSNCTSDSTLLRSEAMAVSWALHNCSPLLPDHASNYRAS